MEYRIQILASIKKAFIEAKVEGSGNFSCDSPPNATLRVFELILDKLVVESMNRTPISIADKSNAWLTESENYYFNNGNDYY